MNLPDEVVRNPHFSRYYRTWQKNPLSIVFIPMAEICREQGLLQEAREICEEGLRHHPDSISGRLMLARVRFDLDQTEQARTLVEGILRELPGQREAKALLERIGRCSGLSEKAPPPVEAAPLWENVTMAGIYADQGEVKIARQIVQRVLQRDPENERALRLLKELKQ